MHHCNHCMCMLMHQAPPLQPAISPIGNAHCMHCMHARLHSTLCAVAWPCQSGHQSDEPHCTAGCHHTVMFAMHRKQGCAEQRLLLGAYAARLLSARHSQGNHLCS